jgi:hypothetical protein
MPESVIEHVLGHLKTIGIEDIFGAHCGGALPAVGWRIGEHAVMGRGPHDGDIDAGHVARVMRGLCDETALAGADRQNDRAKTGK